MLRRRSDRYVERRKILVANVEVDRILGAVMEDLRDEIAHVQPEHRAFAHRVVAARRGEQVSSRTPRSTRPIANSRRPRFVSSP